MGTGNDNNQWGQNLNTSVFQILEDSISNIFVSSAMGGTLDLSGTPPPAGPSQARFWQLKFTGALTSNLLVKVPNLTKEWLVNNQASGSFTISIQTPSGSPVSLPFGWSRIWCDGNNVLNPWPQGQLQNLMPGGSAAFPFYSSVLEPNSGFYRNATQDWRISAAGIDVARFTGAGSGAAAQLVDILSGTSLAFAGVKFDPTAIVPSGTVLPYDGIFPPSGFYLADGSAKTRAGDAPLFNAITAATTGNTHANTTIDNLPIDLRGLGLEGAFIEGTGITLGTTIVSINSASSMTVSAAVAGTNVGVALRILPWGQGDGSTTFNIRDGRGVSLFGRDNMGGTAKGLLTLAQSQGILGTKLNATGGEQGHTDVAAEMPVHNHTATSTVTDPGHTHTITPGVLQAVGSGFSVNGGAGFQTGSETAASSTTGITVGTTTANTGSGAAHNNIPPAAVCNFIVKR